MGGASPPGPVIDLRSDAVTRPTSGMWAAMASDPLDWSRLGDRTVAVLERRVASLLDKPSALFVPTGTMANTLALVSWTAPDDVFVVDEQAHVIRSEDDAYSWVARLCAVRVPGERGHLSADQLEPLLHGRPRPTLLWLENTHTFAGGTVASAGATGRLVRLARQSGMRIHLDGARLWNASVAMGRPIAELAAAGDSVTVNLDKGIGCPGGAVLCGPVDLVETARRRMLGLGGVVAQAGMLAACALMALADPLAPIAGDHERAAILADRLRSAGHEVDEPDTNIVLVRVRDAEEACDRLGREGVLALARDPLTVRFVTHRDIDTAAIARAASVAGSTLVA